MSIRLKEEVTGSDGASCTKVAFNVSTRPSEAVQCSPVLGAAVEAVCYAKGIDSFHFYVSVAFPRGEMSGEFEAFWFIFSGAWTP